MAWIPADHNIVLCRTILWGFVAIPTSKEWYEYVSNPNQQKKKPQKSAKLPLKIPSMPLHSILRGFIFLLSLLNRGLTSGRSDDTNETVIRARITEYEQKTTVVANYYAGFDKVVKIKGEGSVEEIFSSLRSEIDKRLS